MSPTLLEGVAVLAVLVIAWQIGTAIAPDLLRWLRRLGRDIDAAAQAPDQPADTPDRSASSHNEEHSNGTRH